MTTPKYITAGLMRAFRSTYKYDWFPVWDIKINEWLCDKFGLHTNTEELTFNLDAFTVKFDWRIQVWRVRT